MSSSGSGASTSEVRAEAGPLPLKRGEFGYVEEPQMREVTLDEHEPSPLPSHHPADRDHHHENTPSTSTQPTPANNVENLSADNIASSQKKSRLSWHGLSLRTLLKLLLFFVFTSITAVIWAIITKKFSDDIAKENLQRAQEAGYNGPVQLSGFSSLVFVHIAFTTIVLLELLFLERAIYHARAERYLFKHGIPRNAGRTAVMGIAPWSRPPLPTYAAALAESGVGTGDVEDNLIAINPPPAYGNIRGSVLLLAGTLRRSLARTPSSRTVNSEIQMEEGRRTEPITYEESEQIDDARRALQLERTLGTLEGDRHETSRPQNETRVDEQRSSS